jgi:hypothetical protein
MLAALMLHLASDEHRDMAGHCMGPASDAG